MLVYIRQCCFLHSSHPLLPSQCPQVHFLSLPLHFFPVNGFISTIFLDSIYMLIFFFFESSSVVPDSLRPHGLYSLWDSPGQNTGVGSLCLLQGIFPTQGLNPGLPHCRRSLYQLSHKGSPRILDWVAYPFSRGSSRPRSWTGVSCIAGRFFTSWATREALAVS